MNFDHLQTFQAVAKTGSFTKAARKLFLSQPAVSQQIQALEASIGVRLFDRSGKKIHLTGEGEMLLTRTSRIDAELRKISSLFTELSNLSRGRLEIGASAVFGTNFLPGAIGKFNQKYPCIDINLHTGNSHKVISMLLNNRIEFGFGGLIEDEPAMEFTLVHQEKFVAVAGRHHPLARGSRISQDDLAGVPFILREKGTNIRREVDSWLVRNREKFVPERFIELENVETTKRLVEEGYGITIVPQSAVRREVQSGHLKIIDLPGLDLAASYYLFYPKKRTFSRAAHTFLTLLAAAAPLSHGANLATVPL